ncbi:hypothetical protein G6685_07485 [Polynucleobacter paneuropaeus]|jgi:hypothetical protein|nr:hypothetical protein [Polynucleobacter paneuropaeus]
MLSKMNNDELSNCIDECYKWIDDVVSKFNDSQKVEYFRLISFVNATRYQYSSVLSLKSETFFSKIFDEMTDWFSDTRRLTILQIQRDFESTNNHLVDMYRFINHENQLSKLEDTNNVDKEKLTKLRFKTHQFHIEIRKNIIDLITNYSVEDRLPRCYLVIDF